MWNYEYYLWYYLYQSNTAAAMLRWMEQEMNVCEIGVMEKRRSDKIWGQRRSYHLKHTLLCFCTKRGGRKWVFIVLGPLLHVFSCGRTENTGVTCREPYCFWFTFVLENVRDHNTLAKHWNGRALSESAAHVRHEYKCVLFIKACFTASLGSEFNQVSLSPFRSINLRLNKLALHVSRHTSVFYSISTRQLLHISWGNFKFCVHVSNDRLLCANGCVRLN